MKNTYLVLVVVWLSLAFNASVIGNTCDEDGCCLSNSIALYAGQNEYAGEVMYSFENGNVVIQYDLLEGFCMTQSHLYVGSEPPSKNAPGKFPYQRDYNPCVMEDSYTVPVPGGLTDGQVYVAAHAVVEWNCSSGWEDCAVIDTLPDCVQEDVSDGSPVSYFTTTIGLDVFEGWCLDLDHSISYQLYDARVYASCDPSATGLVNHPENFDLINWVINQDWVGQPSGCGGNYTADDVQEALWELAEGGLNPARCRIQEILAAAYEAGEGFEPSCADEDQMVIILAPENDARPEGKCEDLPPAQLNIIAIPVTCSCDSDTAWALNGPNSVAFPRSWAEYFSICRPIPD